MNTCAICSREFVYSRSKGCQKNKCGACLQKIKREKQKQKFLDYKGGKCERCGYSKCSRALSFHHVDPTKKSFTISTFCTNSWERIKKELDKCMLLCANCHMEVENENIGD